MIAGIGAAQADTIDDIAVQWGRAGTEGGEEVAFLLRRASGLMRRIVQHGPDVQFERVPRGTEGDVVENFRAG